MQFCDRLVIDRSHRTQDGYLRVTAKGARTGIQQYKGREVDPEGKHFAADQVVNVYRPPEEVFAAKAVASFVGRPITDDHPSVAVTAANWRDHARGVIGGAVKDGEWIRFDLALMDAELVEKVDGGKRELSCGYRCDIEVKAGETADGAAYDAIQRSIVGNHLAVVDRARAGGDARIHDGGNATFENCDAVPEILDALREKPVPKIMLDGLMVDLSDAEAVQAAVKKLQDRATDAEGKLADAQKALTDATAAHDKALGAKDAEIEKLKEQIVDESKIDALADAKAEVVGKAKAVLGDKLPDTKGKSVADIRRAAVAAKFGDAAVADKSDDYVEARFDAMTADAKVDDKIVPIHSPQAVADADKAIADAYEAMAKHYTARDAA